MTPQFNPPAVADASAAGNAQTTRKSSRSRLPKPILELGFFRKAVKMRLEWDIPIDHAQWARAIAEMIAEQRRPGTGSVSRKPTGANLVKWCRWAGIQPPRNADQVMAAARWAKWKCPKWRAHLGMLLELTTAERDHLQWWLPAAIDETPQAGRRRRALERAKIRANDAKIAAQDAARRDRDRAIRAARKREQRRDEGRPTQAERSAVAERKRELMAEHKISSATLSRRLKNGRLSLSSPPKNEKSRPLVKSRVTGGALGGVLFLSAIRRITSNVPAFPRLRTVVVSAPNRLTA